MKPAFLRGVDGASAVTLHLALIALVLIKMVS